MKKLLWTLTLLWLGVLFRITVFRNGCFSFFANGRRDGRNMLDNVEIKRVFCASERAENHSVILLKSIMKG